MWYVCMIQWKCNIYLIIDTYAKLEAEARINIQVLDSTTDPHMADGSQTPFQTSCLKSVQYRTTLFRIMKKDNRTSLTGLALHLKLFLILQNFLDWRRQGPLVKLTASSTRLDANPSVKVFVYRDFRNWRGARFNGFSARSFGFCFSSYGSGFARRCVFVW